MKIYKRLFYPSILVFLLVACSNEKPVLLENQSIHDDLPNQLNEQEAAISMSTDQEIYKKPVKEIILTIENTGNRTVGIRSGSYVEMLQDGEWYQVPYEHFSFTDGGVPGIESGETYEEDVPIDYITFDLIEGRYRIVKDFNLDSEETTLAAEFSIQ
ncbi:hypothetical protein FQ085_17820 [Planococcus sp. ANT_H30]|uniref:immunoglobulin-like domain-containing protein n=1 Tax=unclassified Planococcus (in: firmicutes) TaxID=2662419 RepID=UPI0011F03DE5|nr:MULTISPECIES: immunoglobulin-like domain-containing protein [unclassified Planococcus (in: firmicutes)]KAA0954735.1 hypothetical protein FQ085_17820 [Planococcus sp. ANT_H30]QJS06510.1 hypothetical protein [Planococcus sp. (in: firmicutes)]